MESVCGQCEQIGADSDFPLRKAVQCGHHICLQGDTALIKACKAGHGTLVDRLIQSGADVNIAPIEGYTALITAVLFRQYDMAKMRVNGGAKVTGETKGVFIALIRASQTGSDANLRLLIDAGADVNITDYKGNTPLITVAGTKTIDTFVCLQILLIVGARINKTNIYNENALRCHISHFKWINRRVVMLLFAAGEKLGSTVQRYSIFGDSFLAEIPEFLKQTELKFCLKHLCRESIRKQLLMLNAHYHLFDRVYKLGLPTLLASYLVYGMSLDI